MDIFRVRLNCIDHYQATPTLYDPQLRNDIRLSQAANEPKVPVIRVFGATEIGQKVCAHIHGAFPYLYIEYHGSLEKETIGGYMYRLHLSIDHALAVSYRHKDTSKAKFVARITLAKGVPFYGFHVGYRFFLKIYLYNPTAMSRLADLLQQGVIMKRRHQPYEAHLGYVLQFMTDYNLYGCGYLESWRAYFRAPVPPYDGERAATIWNDVSIPEENVTHDLELPRVSHCSIEVDICAQDIANRKAIKERRLHHDFVERVRPLGADLKLVPSMAGLWKDEARRRVRKMQKEGASREVLATSSPFPLEALVSMSADPRSALSQHWINEDAFRECLRGIIEDERRETGGVGLSFETFVSKDPLEESVKTVLQSVEDLYPANLRMALGLDDSADPTSSIEVDEDRTKSFIFSDDDFLMDDDPDTTAPGQNPWEEADEPGAIPSEDSSSHGTPQKPKRASPDALVIPPAKRNKVTPPASDRRTLASVAMGLNECHPRDKMQAPTGSQEVALRSQSSCSQSRQQDWIGGKRSKQTLAFPVVKDHNEPETRLCMSQKSQSSSQPQSQDGKLRRVAFDSTTEQARNWPPSTQPEKWQSQGSVTSQSGSELSKLELGFNGKRSAFVLALTPPSVSEVCSTFHELGLYDAVHQDAYYSNEKDVAARPREYAGREYRLESNTVPYLPDFNLDGMPALLPKGQAVAIWKENGEMELGQRQKYCSYRSWEFAQLPPSYSDVSKWWKPKMGAQKLGDGLIKTTSAGLQQKMALTPDTKRLYFSQIDGPTPTPKNKHAFKYSQRRRPIGAKHEVQYMSVMSLEVHVNTRGKLSPNPEEDKVQCIFWTLKADDGGKENLVSGIVVLAEDEDDELSLKIQRQAGPSLVVGETSELDLMVRMVEIVRTHDPDVLTGYEVHGSSWGYLIERARHKYDYDLCDEISRMKKESHGRFGKENDRWGFNTTSTIRVTGRHMINVWRAMRVELNLLQYTMENVAWHLLQRRIPHYSWQTLASWYQSGRPRDLHRLIRYYTSRVRMDIEILDANELIARTSEQARLLGVDFFSVFSRGSQFKVESIMFRLAKPENFVLISPSRAQVGSQNALECLPLVMEPQSSFYPDPLVVLDFQSLYPSVMIAYNYCYSTYLGRAAAWRGGSNKMGFTEYKRDKRLLELLRGEDNVAVAPNGAMYAKSRIRKSLLAKMLTEILETRVMVKTGMKQDKGDRALQQLLNNRQLALKLLANVTYGYASASFSGRMPCSEIADSIVQTGRETLERAIAFIHSVERWNAEVVYGDTDSVFISLKGRTRQQAFDIGNEIAKAVTDMNPRPVKLKFEKVYHPCVLLAKKRYVGYKYESRDQAVPEFDARGIETVRRDGTPAEQKVEERALRLLFDSSDLSAVKSYFQQQCDKIMRGAVSVQDFCFAREVKLGTYSERGPPPPGALISTRKMLEDARAEPQYGERVPYVVVSGGPNARLVDRCVSPKELLENPHRYSLDAEYYILKNIVPPLERIFNLVGANIRAWYDDMPKVQRMRRLAATTEGGSAARRAAGGIQMLETFFLRSASCLVCGTRMPTDATTSISAAGNASHPSSAICSSCAADPSSTTLTLQSRLSREERKYADLVRLCRSCEGGSSAGGEVQCDSMDCPVFYSRRKQASVLRGEQASSGPVLDWIGDKVEGERRRGWLHSRFGHGHGDLEW